MYGHSIRALAVLAAAAATLVAAGSAGAATQRYAMTLDVKTDYGYIAGWKTGVLCSDDVRYATDGKGSGGMAVKGVGLPIRILFRGSSLPEVLLEASVGRVPLKGTVRRTSTYTITRQGVPRSSSCPAPPAPIRSTTCGTKKRQTVDVGLHFDQRGRLFVTGALAKDPFKAGCYDQTGLSASPGSVALGPAGTRHKVKALRRGRTWRHRDTAKISFDRGNLAYPIVLPARTGAGEGTVTWTISLKRIS